MLVMLSKKITKHCHLIKELLPGWNGGQGRKTPLTQHSAEKLTEWFFRTQVAEYLHSPYSSNSFLKNKTNKKLKPPTRIKGGFDFFFSLST